MLKNIYCLILPLLFCSTFMGAQSSYRPTGLMVEFLRNPSRGNVNTPYPNFSWIVNGPNPQINYQILVSSSREKLEAGNGDLWDSEKVGSEQSVNINFIGKPLKPDLTCFWNVRIGIRRSKSLQISEIQEFKTGAFESGIAASVMPLTKHTVQPVEVLKKNSLGNYFADFGKDAFGTLRVQIESQRADSVIIHLGEKLEAPGLIKRNPGGTIRYRFISLYVEQGVQWYTLTIPHIPRNSQSPAISMPADVGEVTPFRYCEIEAFSSATSCKSVEQIAVNYYWDDSESSFSCSDSILSQVWELCKYSIKATSFCGIYVDGDRERIPYEADAYINQLGHYYTDREYSIARHSQEYLMVHPTWPTEWIMHSVMMAYTDYLYTGDTKVLAKFYNKLKYKTLITLERPDYLISTRTGLLNEAILHDLNINEPIRDIVDWPTVERDGNEMPKVNTVINAFHYEALKLMSLIALALGNSADETFYRTRAEAVKETINRKLFDQDQKIYVDGEGSSHASLHANIFPLSFGIVPEVSIPAVSNYIASKGLACSVYAAQYLLESLYTAGEDEAALNLMRSTGERSWWNMIKSGSTITMEAWDEQFKPNLDWNHAWGAVPANMVARGFWGIVPLTPGFETVQIKPQTGGLFYSAIKVPTIRGSVKCEFHSDNTSRFDLSVSIPVNMRAVVSIPVRSIINPVLYVNGKRINGTRNGKFFVAETGGGANLFSVQEGGSR